MVRPSRRIWRASRAASSARRRCAANTQNAPGVVRVLLRGPSWVCRAFGADARCASRKTLLRTHVRARLESSRRWPVGATNYPGWRRWPRRFLVGLQARCACGDCRRGRSPRASVSYPQTRLHSGCCAACPIVVAGANRDSTEGLSSSHRYGLVTPSRPTGSSAHDTGRC